MFSLVVLDTLGVYASLELGGCSLSLDHYGGSQLAVVEVPRDTMGPSRLCGPIYPGFLWLFVRQLPLVVGKNKQLVTLVPKGSKSQTSSHL